MKENEIKKVWSLLEFSKLKGKLQVGTVEDLDTGEKVPMCRFINANNPDPGKGITYVSFSSELGALTAQEISELKNALDVVELKNGNFILCDCYSHRYRCLLSSSNIYS